jgi:site-specific recombinase XerD
MNRGRPMTEQAVKNAFKKYEGDAGLGNEFSVHNLRHTCAVMRIAEGCFVSAKFGSLILWRASFKGSCFI